MSGESTSETPIDTTHHTSTPRASVGDESEAVETTIERGLGIANILTSGTSTASRIARTIFPFQRNDAQEDTIAHQPEAGPSTPRIRSHSPTRQILPDYDSDLESLPELPRLPHTPKRGEAQIKVSNSQQKQALPDNGKGKGPAIDIDDLTSDSDDEIQFVSFKAYSPAPGLFYTPEKLPASQAILNSARGKKGEEERPFTPKRRDPKRRARPSAAHRRAELAKVDALRLSPSLGLQEAGNPPPPTRDDYADESDEPSQSLNRLDLNVMPSVADPPGSPSKTPTPPPHYSFEDLPVHNMGDATFFGKGAEPEDYSTAQREISPHWQQPASPSPPVMLQYNGHHSDSDEIDELADDEDDDDDAVVANQTINPSTPSTEAQYEPLLEMTMEDTIIHIDITTPPANPPIGVSLLLGSPAQTQLPRLVIPEPSIESESTATPMPPTPPDIIVTASKSSPPIPPIDSGIALQEDYHLTPEFSLEASNLSDEEEPSARARIRKVPCNPMEISSDSDSEAATPRQRRDVVIISENNSKKRKSRRQRTRRDIMPDLLFSGAESGTSVEPEGARSHTPTLQPGNASRKRKLNKEREPAHPPGYRHRDAVIWTGREIEGEFPYKEIDLITTSSETSLLIDNHNRARFESLINDQLAREEPRAPRIRLIDPKSDHICPPFNFIYTNRLIYRDKVPAPTKAPGCNCVDGCRPDNPDCNCLKRQQYWSRKFPDPITGVHQGFAYDSKGRCILPEDCPVVECNSNCGCPADCMNRQVSNGRKYALDLVNTAQKGWGVEAASDRPSIRKGSFLCIYSGEVITWREAEKRGQANDDEANPTSYLFDIDSSFMRRTMHEFETAGFQMIGGSGLPASSQEEPDPETEQFVIKQTLYTVDAMKYGNIGRFFNHACSPNACLRSVFCDDADEFKPILALFAKKKIYSGEEITISYRGDVEGASEDHDSSTEDEAHGVNGNLTPRRSNGRKNPTNGRKKQTWRTQGGTRRGRGRGKRRGGRKSNVKGGKGAQAGRINAQTKAAIDVASAECFCGAANCDGFMFPRVESDTEDST